MIKTSEKSDFEKRIGIIFKSKDLLNRVFVHRSYLNENKGEKLESNERLEFLGDAVLELVVTGYLYNNYPNPEGDLTNFRSALVKGVTLSSIAAKLDMDKELKLSRGEKKNFTKSRKLLLANTFEALVGAIYLDLGFTVAQKFIVKYLLPEFQTILAKALFKDSRSSFQEWAQENLSQTPEYRVLEESGPDHNKEFEVGVYVLGKLYGKGKGSSKQLACQQASQRAMDKIRS